MYIVKVSLQAFVMRKLFITLIICYFAFWFSSSVLAIGADELLDRPAGDLLDPAADGQSCEHDAQVGLDRLALAVVDGRACGSCLDIGTTSQSGIAAHRSSRWVRSSGSCRCG